MTWPVAKPWPETPMGRLWALAIGCAGMASASKPSPRSSGYIRASGSCATKRKARLAQIITNITVKRIDFTMIDCKRSRRAQAVLPIRQSFRLHQYALFSCKLLLCSKSNKSGSSKSGPYKPESNKRKSACSMLKLKTQPCVFAAVAML